MSGIKIIDDQKCQLCSGRLMLIDWLTDVHDPLEGLKTSTECSECHAKYILDGHIGKVLTEDKSEVKSETIKSNGGRSDYYEITIDGQTFMIEKIIKQVFRNDFDFANAFKALIRANALIAGGGKEGSTIKYEMNKVKYSADKVAENNGA